MNKKLVALAVAGVFALPMAAQAQTANVTLYGRVNLDFEFVKGDQPDGSDPTINRLSTNSSRFGIRGVESLGGGLSAIFQVENSVNPAQSGGTLAGRESFVGLQGAWGTFKMGRFLSPYDDIHPIFGNVPTLTTSILSTAAIWANAPGTGATPNASYGLTPPGTAANTGAPTGGGFDDRIQNSLRYDTPNISGFTGSVQYGSYNNAVVPIGTTSTQPHAYVASLGAFYTNGPFQGGVAWERHHDLRGADVNDDGVSVALAWNFGVVRVAGFWERLAYDMLPLGAGTGANSGGELKRDAYGVTFTIPAGPGTAYLSWIHGNDGKGSAGDNQQIGGIVHGSDTSANHYTVSYTYPLSKRTLTYVGYTFIQNDSRAQYTFNINAYAVEKGGDPQGLVFGMVHFF